jgi:hypothetical protein
MISTKQLFLKEEKYGTRLEKTIAEFIKNNP